jgi:orotidine-5'-phosphate decarboxylase
VVNPYLGDDVLSSFGLLPEKAALVAVKTSNDGGAIVQELELANGLPLWIHILELSMYRWNKAANVIPITSWKSVARIVELSIPENIIFLIAGVGAQGGTAAALAPWLRHQGPQFFVSSSPALLYPYQPAESKWRQAIEDAVVTMKVELNAIRHES